MAGKLVKSTGKIRAGQSTVDVPRPYFFTMYRPIWWTWRRVDLAISF